MKTTPVEGVLIVCALLLPAGAGAQDAEVPDAALLEFLAEWNGEDIWLEAELDSEAGGIERDSAQSAPRAEKTDE